MRYPAYPAYRDSGFEWLGELPETWEVRRLKNVLACPVTDGPHTTPDFVYEGVPFLSVDGIQNGELQFDGCRFVSIEDHKQFTKKVAPKRGDVLLGKAASTGKIAQVKVDFDFSIWSPLALLRADPKVISSTFLEYSLKSPAVQAQIDVLCTHNTQSNISMDDIPKLVFPVPPSIEQQQIAAFLDWKTGQIDALIAKKKELLEKLKEKRLAVITQAVTKGLNHTAPLRDSGIPWLGQVPEHWEVRRLKFTASEPLMYGANEAAEFDDPEFPRYIRITDVKEDGTLHDDTFRSLPPEVAEPYLLKDGDILLARSGATVGKSFQYLEAWGRAAYAGYLIRFRVDPSVLTARFAYFFMQSDLYWAYINSTLIQATIQNFSADKYDNINVSLPPLDEQKEIVDQIEKQKSVIDKLEAATIQAVECLTEYRTALITAATTGKIDVRDIKIGAIA